MPVVLMLIKTSGLAYDDRVRKETRTLTKLGFSVKLIAVENANEETEPDFPGRTVAKTISLKTRTLLPQRRFLFVKALEMYARFLMEVFRTRPEVVWCHDLQLTGIIPFLVLFRKLGYVQRLVWDQHELPHDAQLNNSRYLWLFRKLANRCDHLIMANEERRSAVTQLLGNRLRTPIEVLQNFPDQIFVELPRLELPPNVREWLSGKPFFLAQGGADRDRYLDELVSAVMQIGHAKLIVVGPYRQQDVSRLAERHGHNFYNKALFTGFIPQLELTPFIDKAVASVVLYDMSNMNKRLCAPNKLYQALVRGTPVIVGVNPTMEHFVREWGCGVILATDGRRAEDLRDGLLQALENGEDYRAAAAAVSPHIRWESQAGRIARIVAMDPARDKTSGSHRMSRRSIT